MAQFAPVAPPHILRKMMEIDERRLFGRYHLWLAHLTVEQKGGFDELFDDYLYSRAVRQLGVRGMNIIMDNSIVELGGSVDDELIIEACHVIEKHDFPINVIPVLPDVMANASETISMVKEAYPRWMGKRDLNKRSWMLVAQGSTWENFTELVDYFFLHNRQDYLNIRWVGIPRVLVRHLGTREHAIRYVQTVAPGRLIHLLGFSENIWDDIKCAKMFGVRGIDSAVPVRYDSILSPSTTEEQIGKRAPDWMTEGVLTQQNMDNVYSVRNWIGETD